MEREDLQNNSKNEKQENTNKYIGQDQKPIEYSTYSSNSINPGGRNLQRQDNSKQNYSLRQLDPSKGEFCFAERKYTLDRNFNFYGNNYIETTDDIAFLFKKLQQSAVENVFLLLVKDSKPTIIHMSMGVINHSLVCDNAISDSISRFRPDKAYIVHNHPQGNLEPSESDIKVVSNLKKKYPGIMQEGIIIDIDSGYYSTFDADHKNILKEVEKSDQVKVQFNVYKFDKQVFYENNFSIYDPKTKYSEVNELVSFIAARRLANTKKLSLIVLTTDNRISANVHLLNNDLKNTKELSLEIEAVTSRFAGSKAVLYGKDIYDESLNIYAKELKEAVSSVVLIDIIDIKHQPEIFIKNQLSEVNYISLSTENVLKEDDYKYAIAKAEHQFENSLNETTVQLSLFDFNNFEKQSAKYTKIEDEEKILVENHLALDEYYKKQSIKDVELGFEKSDIPRFPTDYNWKDQDSFQFPPENKNNISFNHIDLVQAPCGKWAYRVSASIYNEGVHESGINSMNDFFLTKEEAFLNGLEKYITYLDNTLFSKNSIKKISLEYYNKCLNIANEQIEITKSKIQNTNPSLETVNSLPKNPWEMTSQEFNDLNYEGYDVTGWNESEEKKYADELIQKSSEIDKTNSKEAKDEANDLIIAAQIIADKYFEENGHEQIVRRAFEEGKIIPEPVLQQYNLSNKKETSITTENNPEFYNTNPNFALEFGSFPQEAKGFLVNKNRSEDLKSQYPNLLKYNDNNLNTASPLELWYLAQMEEPRHYGFNITRVSLKTEFEKRGYEIAKEIGLPTGLEHPIINFYTGNVTSLDYILGEKENNWYEYISIYRPVANIEGLINKKQVDLISLNESKTSLGKKEKYKYNLTTSKIQALSEEINYLKEFQKENIFNKDKEFVDSLNKQPWEMNEQEFISWCAHYETDPQTRWHAQMMILENSPDNGFVKSSRIEIIDNAIAEGKNIPSHVMEDYKHLVSNNFHIDMTNATEYLNIQNTIENIERHGFSEIREKYGVTYYTGFYHNQYFEVNFDNSQGGFWTIEKGDFKGQESEKVLDLLAEWIYKGDHTGDKVYEAWIKQNRNDIEENLIKQPEITSYQPIPDINYEDISNLKREEKISIFSSDVNYSTRKVLNRAEGIKIEESLVDKIEDRGITLEELETLNVPVFKYVTQITIHGEFDGDFGKRVGGYKSLILNQNKSLGVKYPAIDSQKKKIIKQSIFLNKHANPLDDKTLWHVHENSTSFMLQYYKIVTPENISELKDQFSTTFKNIPDNYIGNKYFYFINLPFIGKVACIDVHVKAIYEKDLYDFVSAITNGFIKSKEDFTQNEELYKSEREAENLKLKQEAEQRQKEKQEIFQTKYIPAKENLDKSCPFLKISKLPETDNFRIANIFNDNGEAKISIRDVTKQRGFYYSKQYEPVSSWDAVSNNDLKELTTSFNHKKTIKINQLKASFEKSNQNGTYFYDLNKKNLSKITPVNPISVINPVSEEIKTIENKTDISIIRYTKYSYAIIGTTKPIKDILNLNKATFNKYLTHPDTKEKIPGWLFPLYRLKEFETLLNIKYVENQNDNKQEAQSTESNILENTFAITQETLYNKIFGDVSIIKYSDKSYAVIGETKPIKDILDQNKATFNGRLRHPVTKNIIPGWVFPNARLSQFEQLLTTLFNEKDKNIEKTIVEHVPEINNNFTPESLLNSLEDKLRYPLHAYLKDDQIFIDLFSVHATPSDMFTPDNEGYVKIEFFSDSIAYSNTAISNEIYGYDINNTKIIDFISDHINTLEKSLLDKGSILVIDDPYNFKNEDFVKNNILQAITNDLFDKNLPQEQNDVLKYINSLEESLNKYGYDLPSNIHFVRSKVSKSIEQENKPNINSNLLPEFKKLFESIEKIIPDISNQNEGFYKKSGNEGDKNDPLSCEIQELPDYFNIFKNEGKQGYFLIMEQFYVQEGDIMSDPRIDFAIYPEERLAVPLTYTKSTYNKYTEFVEEGKISNEKELRNTGIFVTDTWIPNLILEERTFPIENPTQIENIPVNEKPEEKQVEKSLKSNQELFIETIRQKISKGEKILNTPELLRIAASCGLTLGKDYFNIKELYDMAGFALNMHIAWGGTFYTNNKTIDEAKKDIDNLNQLQDLLPTETQKSSTQVELQQYSTPPSLAYIANLAAGVNSSDIMLEPSAGEGNIAVFAKLNGAKVIANEIDKQRLSLLKSLNIDKTTSEDAKHIHSVNALLKEKITVVVMNPPFSRDVALGNKLDLHAAEKHIESALHKLEESGRLVAIVGRGMSMDSHTHKDWWNKIKKDYHVIANISINGDTYSKKGTSFDNRLLVIDKTGETFSSEPIITGEVNNFNQLLEIVYTIPKKENLNLNIDNYDSTREHSTGEVISASGSTSKAIPGNDISSRDREPKTEHERQSVDGRSNTGLSINDRRTDNKVSSGRGRRSNKSIKGNKNTGPNNTEAFNENSLPGNDRADGQFSNNEVKEFEKLTIVRNPRNLKQKDDVGYDEYQAEITIEGSKPHPTKLVESTAMASVSLPKVNYVPVLDKNIIVKGILSDAQLEDIILAGNSHKQILLNGETRGYFIGSGTGVGKGRTIAAIILDNFNQGRKKAVWISKNDKAHYDTSTYWQDIGGNPKLLFEQKNPNNPIKVSEGVLILKYGTLSNKFDKRLYYNNDTFWIEKPQNRLQQIVQWLGKDFDGVIVFDESHKMANSKETKGERGIKKASNTALAGIEFQNLLPKAKVVYSSATGATEVSNLSYAKRFGLWGDGTAFGTSDEFIHAVEASGIAGMEIISRDLKSMGLYTSKSISFEGVEYETLKHILTPEQKNLYNKVAYAWQIVLNNIDECLEINQSSKNAKAAALSAFWGAHQRFFSNIILVMEMPTVLSDIQKELDNGNAIVLQLVNTNDAISKRAIAEAKSEISEGEEIDYNLIDVSPKKTLIEFLQKSFPVAQFEEAYDNEGNKIQVLVRDSEGNPVLNSIAVAKRDALISQIDREIQLPETPLDILVNTFGVDNVAEITGRNSRIVQIPDEKGEFRKVEQSRTENSVSKDKDDFMDANKNILIFSTAGGTGASFHSDKNRKNQKQRIHYVLQSGWRADDAVQGFGRTHRSNERVPPKYKLVTTDLKAQMRFLSSIAKRLDQLGALTKGQRQTGGQGILDGTFNLEGAYARQALFEFYQNVEKGFYPGINMDVLERQMALKIYIEDQDGNRNYNEDVIFNTKMFLNRLMSLDVDLMDKVFDSFIENIEEQINTAKANCTYEEGIEIVKAINTKVIDEIEIYSDPSTGAKTYITTLELEVKNNKQSYEEIISKLSRYGKEFKGFYIENNSGHIYAIVKQNYMDYDGKKTTKYRRFSIVNDKFIENSDFTDKYEKIDKSDAKKLWDEQFINYPSTRKKTEHIVKGLMLPIWNRLPNTISVRRYVDENGTPHLGRYFSKKDVETIIQNFGVEKTQYFSPSLIVKTILKGGEAKLANGFGFILKKYQGNNVIQITNTNRYTHGDRLQRCGAIFTVTHTLTMNGNYFIPLNNAEETIQNIIDVFNAPVISLEDKNGNSVSGERIEKENEIKTTYNNVVNESNTNNISDNQNFEISEKEITINSKLLDAFEKIQNTIVEYNSRIIKISDTEYNITLGNAGKILTLNLAENEVIIHNKEDKTFSSFESFESLFSHIVLTGLLDDNIDIARKQKYYYSIIYEEITNSNNINNQHEFDNTNSTNQKEPWQMTFSEYSETKNISLDNPKIKLLLSEYDQILIKAILDGKPVPVEVLEKYNENKPNEEVSENTNNNINEHSNSEINQEQPKSFDITNDISSEETNESSKNNPQPSDSNINSSGEIENELDEEEIDVESYKSIKDFGEKIGGARKDTAERGFTFKMNENYKKDDRPGWMRKYDIVPNANGSFSIVISNPKIKSGPRSAIFIDQKFDTRDDALDTIPLIEVSQRHRVYKDHENKGQYAIYRRFSNNKTFKVKSGFSNENEATSYFVTNAIDIINYKTPFPEIPHLDKIERIGEFYREGNVSPEMFQETFGFRGGEFGNWLPNDERQAVLNYSYDCLMDLATILNVPPKALSLNGELSVAFGSRGHGLDGHKAHYERERGVFNLTRIKGAGSVAHEWFHAFDHYIARQDGKAKPRGEDGLYPKKSHTYTFQTYGESYNSKLRIELKNCINEVVSSMTKKIAVVEVDINFYQKRYDTSNDNLRESLNEIRAYLKSDHTQYNKFDKPATQEQLDEFDKIATKILKGDVGNQQFTYSKRSKHMGTWNYDATLELSSLMKKVKNTEGLGNHGKITSLYYRIKSNLERKSELEKFKIDAKTEKKVNTNFYNEAKKLDESRASDYWSSPHELAARAFSSYISDKLDSMGHRSDYLVYGADNKFYKDPIFGDSKPYPEGEERLLINNSFDKLFSTIQTVEHNDNIAMFKKHSIDDHDQREQVVLENKVTLIDTNTQKFNILDIDSKRYQYCPSTGELIIGKHNTLGNSINSSHRTDYEQFKTKAPYNDFIKGHITVKPPYTNGIIRFYTRDFSDKIKERIDTVNMFTNNGANDETLLVNFITEKPAIIKSFENIIMFKKNLDNVFYSTIDRALYNITQEKATKEQWLAMLKNNGAKQDELKWLNIDDLLSKNKITTKEEIINYIAQNKIILQEVVFDKYASGIQYNLNPDSSYNFYFKGDLLCHFPTTKMLTPEKAFDIWKTEIYSKNKSSFNNLNDKDLFLNGKYNEQQDKFFSFSTSGGNNYKEILITIPSISGDSFDMDKQFSYLKQIKDNQYQLCKYSDDSVIFTGTKDSCIFFGKEENYNVLSSKSELENIFTSNHWPIGNTLLHVRLQEFINDKNEKVLHIDEIQSDWQQKGRTQGFRSDYLIFANKSRNDFENYTKYLQDKYKTNILNGLITEEEQTKWFNLYDKYSNLEYNFLKQYKSHVPDMPFKKSEQIISLAFKRIIRYAAEKGFEKVSWTKGDQQVLRYSINNKIEKLQYWIMPDNTYGFSAYRNKEDSVPSIKENFLTAIELQEYLGKELSQKIINNNHQTDKINQTYYGIIESDNLHIASSKQDKGLIRFYDEIIPSVTKPYIRQWGVSISNTNIDIKPNILNNGINMETGEIVDVPKDKYLQVHSFDITSKMSQSVFNGQPLFKSNNNFSKFSYSQSFEDHFFKVKNTIDKINSNVENAINTIVIKSQKELLSKLKELNVSDLQYSRIESNMHNRIDSLYEPESNSIIIIAENVNSDTSSLKALWLHEQGQHHGINLLIPDKTERNLLFKKITHDIGRENIIKHIGKSYEDENDYTLGNEYLAFIAEKVYRDLPLEKSEKNIWNMVLEKFNKIVSKIFSDPNYKITNLDAARIVRASILKVQGLNKEISKDKSINISTSEPSKKAINNNFNNSL